MGKPVNVLCNAWHVDTLGFQKSGIHNTRDVQHMGCLTHGTVSTRGPFLLAHWVLHTLDFEHMGTNTLDVCSLGLLTHGLFFIHDIFAHATL